MQINRNTRTLSLLVVGSVLVVLGVLMPALMTVHDFSVYETMQQGIQQEEKLYLLLAALKLVVLNALRCFPHYLGTFFIAEAIDFSNKESRKLISVICVCLLIPAVYVVIEQIYGIHYDFGVPAFLMLTMLAVLSKVNFDFIGLEKKAFMVALMVLAFQFLDVMPALHRLPFGRGETSIDIKMASAFMGADSFLQGTAMLFFVLFFVLSLLQLMLIVDENNIKKISELKEQNEHMLMETRMRILENRTYMELQHLVHDLKSPLTSMQALVGVVMMANERDGRERDVAYLKNVESSIERMSSMISEILYEELRVAVSTQELLKGVLSQISIAEYASLVITVNEAPHVLVLVNKIRFSRALINLIENSFYAIDKKEGVISLRITLDPSPEGKHVRFEVQDNGVGIPEDLLTKVWEKEFSTHSSHGLGLSFVQNVVRQHGGEALIESKEGSGTLAVIRLPAFDEEGEVHYDAT